MFCGYRKRLWSHYIRLPEMSFYLYFLIINSWFQYSDHIKNMHETRISIWRKSILRYSGVHVWPRENRAPTARSGQHSTSGEVTGKSQCVIQRSRDRTICSTQKTFHSSMLSASVIGTKDCARGQIHYQPNKMFFSLSINKGAISLITHELARLFSPSQVSSSDSVSVSVFLISVPDWNNPT